MLLITSSSSLNMTAGQKRLGRPLQLPSNLIRILRRLATTYDPTPFDVTDNIWLLVLHFYLTCLLSVVVLAGRKVILFMASSATALANEVARATRIEERTAVFMSPTGVSDLTRRFQTDMLRRNLFCTTPSTIQIRVHRRTAQQLG
ncbi:uncharacterized protein BJX67DRAFT_281005 [Aspergillus lucknowensis]|uniref:Uncharacterized protein n=1 Tax=Aspergillus lucknowensis TaxID=176173 RepID=A0ABR4M0L4_9EURO